MSHPLPRAWQSAADVGFAQLRVLVVMQDPRDIDAASDSSMAMVAELRRRQHHVDTCAAASLSVGCAGLLTRPFPDASDGGAASRLVADYDAVLVRTDPPFDTEYLHATLLLDLVREDCLLMNDPRALRDTNEKLFPLQFPDLAPPSIVTSSTEDLLQFMDREDGRLVIKPIDGCGGQGIFVLDDSDPNLSAILEAATACGARRVIGQRYLAAAQSGDKRIILLDGEPIGTFLRRPAPGQARANLHAGGTAEPAELDTRDLEIIDRVGPRCRQDGLVLVGLDVIGGWLTEVNVTSPAGFRTLSRLTGIRPESTVIDWIEAAVASRLAVRCSLRSERPKHAMMQSLATASPSMLAVA